MEVDAIRKNISKNIGKYREAKGMSQKELAKKLGVVPSRISNWETGANCPTIDILFEVCEILEVSVNDIYGVYPDTEFVLAYDEIDHIKKYRVLDSHGKEMVDFTLLKEWERSMQDQKAEGKLISMALREDTSYVNAAHAEDYAGAPEDLKQLEEDIMDAEDF